MKRFLICALALCVAACGPTHLEYVKPPADKLTCSDEPPAPASPVTDAGAADYMIALRTAWQDCHGKVTWLRVYTEKLGK